MAAPGFRNIIQAATVYVEGRSYVGEAASVTLPNIEMQTQDDRPMGLASPIRRFTGYEPMEATLVFNTINKDVLVQVGSPNIRAKNYMVRYSTQSSDGSVKFGIAEFSGRASMIERSEISNGEEITTTTLTIQCVAYKETFDGEGVYDIDTEKQQFIIDGTDHWAPVAAGL